MVNILTEREIKELLIATVGLGAAFAIMFFGGDNKLAFVYSAQFLPAFLASTAIAAVSFIPHEMAHRSTARVVEAYAEFRMWSLGVVAAVLTAFLGVVFAAPGGVEIFARPSERWGRHEPDLAPHHIGLISVVGPLMNISMAVIFAFLADFYGGALSLYGVDLLVMGSRLNAYLAVFNLLPVYPIDGYKVVRWSAPIWALSFGMALLSLLVV